MTVSVGPGWLADRSRRFPVSLDPDYYSYGASATLISGAKADTNISGPGSNVCAGWDNPASSSPERGVVKFPDVGITVKPDAEIVASVVGAHVTSVAGAAQVAVYPLTRPVDPSTATWNQAAAGVRWTSPGGDFRAAEGDNPQTISAPDGSNVFHHWNMNPDIAQGWLRSGGQTGFLFKASNEAVSSQVCMTGSTDANYGPFLDLIWQARTGIRPDQKYFDHAIDEHESVHVNLANNNLVITSKEFGVGLGIFRTWNLSQAGQVWQNGYGWFQAPGESGNFSFGPNPSVFLQKDGTSFKDPAGAGGAPWQPWHLKDYTYQGALPAGVDRPPPGVHATSGFVNGNDRTVTDNGSGTVDTFTTASNGQDAKITDRNGNTETIGHSGVFTPNNDSYPTAVQDSAGRAWTFNHTTAGTGFYTSITAPPVGGSTPTASYSYSGGSAFTGVAGDGQLLTATDAGGGVTTYAYDSSQRITKITSPAGRQITIGYVGDHYGTSSVGSLTLVTDPATGAGHTFYFDGSGFSTTAGGGTATDTVTDPDGNKTVYTYNPDDQIIKTTDALGHARSASYGPDGNVTTAVDAMGNGNTSGNTSTNSYDADNRATGSTAPTGAQNSVRYAEAPGPVTNRAAHYQPSGGTDPNGSASSLTYDGPGNLKSSSTAAPGGAVAQTFTYNPPAGGTMICGGKPGQLCTSTDGNNHVTSNTYDSSGNLITRTPPAPLPASHYSYDALGRVATATDGKGQLTRYGYDLLNRVTTVQFSGTSSCTSSDISAGRCLTYSYDSDGNRLSQLDQTGTTSYGYDQLGREVTRNLPGRSTMSLSYDNAGNVETVTDAAGTIVYGYDIDNQLISLAEPGGSCTASPTVACTSFGYNNNGLRTSTSYPTAPNRTVISLTPDNSGRPADIKTVNGSTVLADFSYAYSYGTSPVKDGALATRRVDVPNSLTTSYAYDTLNRLTAATEKNGGGATTASWNYGYDNAGNRTGATINGAANTFGFNNANELTSRNGNSSGFSYDPNGNETGAVGAATRTAETWNDHNQLTSATAGGSSIPFTYTGLGQDLRTNAGATSIRNTQLGITGLTTGSSTTNLVRDPAGTLIATHTAGASSYYLYDGQGSVIGLVDATGTKINSYSYDPYGNNRAKTETIANPFQYTAGYLDTATGLYKLGARYYDPTLGRFTQQDPSGQDNGYVYAADDPVNNLDPSGDAYYQVVQVGATTDTITVRFIALGGDARLATGYGIVRVSHGSQLTEFNFANNGSNVSGPVTFSAYDFEFESFSFRLFDPYQNMKQIGKRVILRTIVGV